MESTKQIAKHLREVFFGGNWTWSNMKDVLAGITYQQATQKVQDLNTIAALTFHIGYYVTAITSVLKNEPFASKDEESFAHPAIQSEEDWNALVEKTLANAEILAALIEQVPDEKLTEIFVKEKYGIYNRNFWGLIEHTHYHLGQIAIIKKLV